MIICSSNNIDFIQGVIAYGNEPSITDWRIANSNGVFNILNSKSNNASLSILENSNVGIGIANPSSSLDVNGDINITGNYKRNNRDVLNDTSNYVLSTSNILVNRILTEVRYTSNYIGNVSIGGSGGGSSQWTTLNANIYYNTCNVGIGTTNPINKLHIYNDVNETESFTIQNNFTSTGFPTAIEVVGASGGNIGTTDRYIMFPYSGTSSFKEYTFTTTEILNCDILIVGGGGAGGQWMGGGGGAGGVVYAISQTLPVATYRVRVGKGGVGINSSTNPSQLGINQDGVESSLMNSDASSYITLTLGSVSQQLRGLGGGGGATYNLPETINGRSGGSGGGCSETWQNGWVINTAGTTTQPATYWNGTAYVAGGKAGRQNTNTTQDYGAGGGGGLGGQATDYRNGNDGVAINITGTSQFYAAGGGSGQYGEAGVPISTSAGLGGSSIGGNGRIFSAVSNSYFAAPRNQATSGADGTGSGGGGGAFTQAPTGYAGNGGTGIVIIRYRKSSKTNASIELIRGLSNDSNRDYKIGNYDGDFKIFASFSNVDTEYFKISPSGPSIYNSTGSPNWATTSDIRIKENIENASYDKCYENINNLGLFRFNYIKEFNNNNKDIRQLGFIAQEVNEIFPKAVSSYNFNNGDLSIPNLLSIDITQINYSLYGAVKKLIEINEIKKLRIKKLENLLYLHTIATSNIIY